MGGGRPPAGQRNTIMARVYSLPNFNLLVDSWDLSTDPLVTPPQFPNIPAQLYWNARAPMVLQWSTSIPWFLPVLLRTPLGAHRPLKGDVWRQQGILTDFYVVVWSAKTHPGFPNEYNTAFSLRSNSGGTPFTVGPP